VKSNEIERLVKVKVGLKYIKYPFNFNTFTINYEHTHFLIIILVKHWKELKIQ